MGSRKPHEHACTRGTNPAPDQLPDAKELAAQVSGTVVDAVMSKLVAVGLTAENIKKLQSLRETPLGAVGGGSEAASVADAVASRLAAIGLTEENIKKLAALEGGVPSHAAAGLSQVTRAPLHLDGDSDSCGAPSPTPAEDPFDSFAWATESEWQSPPSSAQASLGRPKRPAEGGPPRSEAQQPATPPRPSKKLHPFYTRPQGYSTPPFQFSRQQKRAAAPENAAQHWQEATLPQPKKRTRRDGAGHEEEEGDHAGVCLGEEWQGCLGADSEIWVGTPLQ